MSFKVLSAIIATSFFAVPAFSMELNCSSRYFMNTSAKVQLTASSGSEDELTNINLTIDGEKVRRQRISRGQEYSGRKYKNMMLFDLGQSANYASFSLLLPQGWGEQGRFIGFLVVKASDGGTYNKMFCGTMD